MGTVVRLASNVILLPFVLTKFSQTEQAIWFVFIALGNFANLADFGFGQVISRLYTFLWAGARDFEAETPEPASTSDEPNIDGLVRLHATVRGLYLGLGLCAMIVLGVAGTPFLINLAEAAPEPRRVWILWGFQLLAIGYTLGTGHWLLAGQGTNRVREIYRASMAGSFVYVISAAFLLQIGSGLASVVIASALRGLVVRHFTFRAVAAAVPQMAHNAANFDRQIVRRLWPQAWKFGVLSLGGYFLANGSVLVSSAFLSKETTAAIGLTAQVAGFLMTTSTLWTAVKWPTITILRTQRQLREMSILFARRLFLVIVTYVIGVMFVCVFGDRLLAFKGSQTRLLPKPYLIFYFAYLGQQILYVQFAILSLTQNAVPFFKLSLFSGVLMLVLSFVLTQRYGLWGLLLAPWLVETAGSAWYVTWKSFKSQPLSVAQFLKAGLFGNA